MGRSRPVVPMKTWSVVLILAPMACLAPLRERPVALDPSSPRAPEAARAVRSVAFDAPADEPGGAVTADAGVYACPMHPEVTDRKPGRCPQCGMTLELTQ